MKKKVLLTVIPALMILSSCAYANRAANVENNPNFFVEDTLAHDEIFGDLERPTLKTARNLDPVFTGTEPAYGIQFKRHTAEINSVVTDVISIRYIAAIKVTDSNGDGVIDDEELAATSASWLRTMYEGDGDLFKDPAAKNCTKAYTSIYDGDGELTIAAFNTARGGTDYTHFVMYSMINIPEETYGSYSLVASLSLGGGAPTKMVATSVDQTKQLVIDTSDANQRNCYFVKGKRANGDEFVVKADTDTKGEPGTNFASFTFDVEENDNFVIVNNGVDSKFAIYGSADLRGGTSDFTFENASGKIKAKIDESAILYLNKSGQIYTSISGEYYQLFINDVISPISSVVPGGWDDHAVFSNVAVTSVNSKLKVKLNGELVSEKDVYGIGNYIVGLNDSDVLWAKLTGNNTLYFSKPAEGWSEVYLYAWDSANDTIKNAAWPGVAMTDTLATNDMGQKIYSITLNLSLYNTIIINNNNGTQSGNTDASGLIHNAFYFNGGSALGLWAHDPA